MHDEITGRLDRLRGEYETGERQLRQLIQQESGLRETLLRISGAIQVLEELLAGEGAAPPGDPEPPAGPAGPEVLSVPS